MASPEKTEPTTSTERRATPEQVSAGGGLEVRNWGRDLVSYPQVVVEARSVDDVVAVMRDSERYPSPVRPHGSTHSTTQCTAADGGTVVDMRALNRILQIGSDTVTAEGGALLIDVAKELERNSLQFYVNIELGNATLGSVACSATKDASMPGEYGQANSYCVRMKIVTASGDVVEITEDDPELLQAARSSYGLLGIVVEATFRVRPLQAMSVEHRVFSIDDFAAALPGLAGGGHSNMLYIFPYLDKVGVEIRRYTGDASRAEKAPTHFAWRLRNKTWKSFAPGLGYLVERFIPSRRIRYFVINRFNRLMQIMMTRTIKGSHTVPTDQMIRYPSESGWSRYTFSIWAFPQERYADTLREYFAWAKRYYREQGWRPNLLHVGYRIEQDQSSLLSYTWDGPVVTIDPVSTGATGWREFLRAYNEFCSEHGGSPLLNQTWGLTPEQVRKAFGERLERFEQVRRRYDPDDRLLNGYFRELLA
jgi:FAD/FMN-containing dehydrogenase